MQVSPKLRTASTVMAWLSLGGAALFAVAVPLAFLVPNPMIHFAGLNLGFTVDHITAATPLLYRVAALGIAAIPVGLGLWMAITLFRLFRAYAAGRVFDATAISLLNRVASLMFGMVLTSKMAEAAHSMILAWAAGGHGLFVSVGITTEWLGYLFVAGVAVVIARVMAEAQRLADENAKFI